MLGFLKSTTPIAIDFGYSTVKVLQVVPGDNPELVGAVCEEIPIHIRGNPEERFRFLSESLPGLVQKGRFRGKQAMCSIPAWQTFVQHMQLEKSESVSVGDQVRAQLQLALGCDPENAVFRNVVVGDVFRQGQAMTEIICFAIGREVIMRQVELLKRCKLEVAGLHAECPAALRAYDHLYRRAGDDQITTLYLDVGAHGTKAIIAHGRELRFAKSIPVGGRHFDEEIARALHCDIDAAFEHRMAEAHADSTVPNNTSAATSGMDQVSPTPRQGAMLSIASSQSGDGASAMTDHSSIATAVSEERRQGMLPKDFQSIDSGTSSSDPTGSHHGHQPDDDSSDQSIVRDAMKDIMLQLVDETRMCTRYHRALFPDRPIDRMILIGGESRDAELSREIASILGLSAYVGDPIKRFACTESTHVVGMDDVLNQPGWAVPVGLSLSPTEG